MEELQRQVLLGNNAHTTSKVFMAESIGADAKATSVMQQHQSLTPNKTLAEEEEQVNDNSADNYSLHASLTQLASKITSASFSEPGNAVTRYSIHRQEDSSSNCAPATTIKTPMTSQEGPVEDVNKKSSVVVLKTTEPEPT